MASGPWFYVDGGQQCGPVSAEELAAWILGGHLPRAVPVWRDGMSQWMPAEALPEIASRLQGSATAFYLMGQTGPQGPIEAPVLMEWARAGRIARDTLIWREGLPEWIAAGTLPELAASLAAPANTYYTPTTPGAYARPAAGPLTGAGEPFPAEVRPASDRDGPCPLCGDTRKMAGRARLLYDHWICRRCSNGLANRRQLAWLLDLLPLWGVMLILGMAVGSLGGWEGLGAGSGLAAVPWLAYVVWLLKDGFDGHSLGKRVMGLQVVDASNGVGARFGASFRRNLPMLIPFAPLVAAFQMTRGPRLGDGWANTRVIWKKHRGRGPF
jgi:uncharacterized RDD family membrane protein YckC